MPKKTTKPKKSEKTVKSAEMKKEHYFETVGRRKTAVARVRIFKDSKENKSKKHSEIFINNKSLPVYFPLKKQQDVVLAPFNKLSIGAYKTTIKVGGGGMSAQAEAIRLGIARALVLSDINLRPGLKAVGFLRRDPRKVERKKPGLRKARRPQQWRKR